MYWKSIAIIVFPLILVGCNTNIATHSQPVQLQASVAPAQTWVLSQAFSMKLRSGYDMDTIPAGTTWRTLGTIPQGLVLKPVDTVLTVDAGDHYDAELVVKGNQAVGLYLPVEATFVSAAHPAPIFLRKQS